MKHVLFLCTGNTCRSPMAAALFDRYAREQGMDASADSAGLAAWPGERVSPHAVTVMAELGADVSANVAQPVTKELLDAADRIFCISRGREAACGKPSELFENEGKAKSYGLSLPLLYKFSSQVKEALSKDYPGIDVLPPYPDAQNEAASIIRSAMKC